MSPTRPYSTTRQWDSHRLLVLLHSSQFRCILLLFFGPDPEPVADALLGPEVDSGKGVGPSGGPEGILTVGISILIVHQVPPVSWTMGYKWQLRSQWPRYAMCGAV